MLAVADLSSSSSSNSAKYKCAWIKAKLIRCYILYARECPDACSRALFIALKHKEISSIMAVTSANFPKNLCQWNYLTLTKEKMFSHATSVGNKQKQTEYRKKIVYNIVSIASSPSKKAYIKKGHAIKDLLQCSISSAYCQKTMILQNEDI